MEQGYYEWACFTAQQAAEKVLKAFGLKLGIDLWGHSILNMARMIEEETDVRIPQHVYDAAKILDKYYIPTRYPNGFALGKPADYYDSKNAEEALNAAKDIFRFCEGFLD